MRERDKERDRQRETERTNHTCEISPKPFQASHFAFPTKSIIPGFFVLHFPTVAWVKKIILEFDFQM